MLVVLLNFFALIFSPDSTSHAMVKSAEDSVKRPKRFEKSDTLRIGKFLNVNRVFIIGNRITRDPVILRELSLKQGDVVFSADVPDILDLDRKKLLNTRLFNTVEIRTIETEDMRIDLIVEVNERWYTFPAPIFELADRNFNEAGANNCCHNHIDREGVNILFWFSFLAIHVVKYLLAYQEAEGEKQTVPS